MHVKQGQAKALSNTSKTDVFKVLAFLVLEKNQPVLEIKEQ